MRLDWDQLKIDRYADNIKDLPDRIENQADWLKRKFDGRTDKEVKERHNALVDLLAQLKAEWGVTSEDIRGVRLNSAGALEITRDGVTWLAVGSGGHAIQTPDGGVLPMRPALRFGGESMVEDVPGEGVTLIKGIKGDKGEAGAVVSLSPGLFELSVQDGHLMLTHNDNEPAPPFELRDGRLVYVID